MDTNEQAIVDNYPDEEITIMPEYDGAILGICEVTNRAVYSETKCLEILMEGGSSLDEAVDWFEFNTVRGNMYGGEPVIIVRDRFMP